MATQAEIDECYEVAVELAKRAGAVSKCHLCVQLFAFSMVAFTGACHTSMT